MKETDLIRLKKMLPKIPTINSKNEYLNTAVLAALMWKNGEYHFVFQKRGENIRQPGEICFPGGKLDQEKDTSLQETAIRETIEEMGLAREQIKIIGNLDTVVSLNGITVDACLGILEIESLDCLQANKDEVKEVFSLPVSFFLQKPPEKYSVKVLISPWDKDKDGKEVALFPAKELGLSEIYTKTWGGNKVNIYAYPTEYGLIWGITARFIYDIVTKLQNKGIL